MNNRKKIEAFLTNDDGLNLLKAVDLLNPITIPANKIHTIKDLSVYMGLPLKETWMLVDEAYDAGLVMFCGGLLSRKKIDLTDLGEMFCECSTPEHIKEVLKNVKD